MLKMNTQRGRGTSVKFRIIRISVRLAFKKITLAHERHLVFSLIDMYADSYIFKYIVIIVKIDSCSRCV